MARRGPPARGFASAPLGVGRSLTLCPANRRVGGPSRAIRAQRLHWMFLAAQRGYESEADRAARLFLAAGDCLSLEFAGTPANSRRVAPARRKKRPVQGPGRQAGAATARDGPPTRRFALALTGRRSRSLPAPASSGLPSSAAAGCRAGLRPSRPGPP